MDTHTTATADEAEDVPPQEADYSVYRAAPKIADMEVRIRGIERAARYEHDKREPCRYQVYYLGGLVHSTEAMLHVTAALVAAPQMRNAWAQVQVRVTGVVKEGCAWHALRFEVKGCASVQLAAAVKQAGVVKVGVTTLQPAGSGLFRAPASTSKSGAWHGNGADFQLVHHRFAALVAGQAQQPAE